MNPSPRMGHNARYAFTLIEILIVVVILGILAAIVVPKFTNASNKTAITIPNAFIAPPL